MSNPVKVQVFFFANTWKDYFKLKFVELVVILQILENPFMLNVQSTLPANILVMRTEIKIILSAMKNNCFLTCEGGIDKAVNENCSH